MILRKCLLCAGLSYCVQPDLEKSPKELQIEYDTQPTVEHCETVEPTQDVANPLYEKLDQIEKLIKKIDDSRVPPTPRLDALKYVVSTCIAFLFVSNMGLMAYNIGVMATNIGVMATNMGIVINNIPTYLKNTVSLVHYFDEEHPLFTKVLLNACIVPTPSNTSE